MKIFLLNFMPRSNRICKSYPDLAGYASFLHPGSASGFDATAFKYGDGIITNFVLNVDLSEGGPDYAIITDDEGVVKTRWFVEEIDYIRAGQYNLKFYRDVIADYKESILSATCLIEKAIVSDNDPAIWNQEPMTFNSIKKSEKLLKDSTGSAWLVGYVSSDNSANMTFEATSNTNIRKNVAGIANWEYYNFRTGDSGTDFVGALQDVRYNVKVTGYNSNEGMWEMAMAFNPDGPARIDVIRAKYGYAQLFSGDYAYTPNPNLFNTSFVSVQKGISGYTYSMSEVYNSFIGRTSDINDIDSTFRGLVGHTASQEGELKGLDGLLIRDTTASKTYRVRVIQTANMEMDRYSVVKNSSLFNKMKNMLTATGKVNWNNGVDDVTKDTYVKYWTNRYRIELTEIDDQTVECSFTSSRRILNDAPYTMFAIPYHKIGINYLANGSTTRVESSPDLSIAMARQISMQLMSSGALYDLQLLPYCPCQNMINMGEIDVTASTEDYDYTFITLPGTTTVKSIVLFAKESSFTFDILETIDITNKKRQNQTDSWRLCSPNYNGVFEFNAVKNNGVNYFNVDCTYRPFNPYIHVNPNFKALYGNDYDDSRGLICSGDFSMPACTSRWLEYEAQNKTYQQSFDRSIQHMEVEQKYQRISQVTGAITGVAGGAISGSFIAGLPGAIAGGVASAGGGIADLILGEKLRQETKDYAKDQFAFNLENIKALPNTLAKVSAFNKNNKIWPFIEHYSCTDIEAQAFEASIEYDGMTVNRIGHIIDYIGGDDVKYVRASMIRCDIHEDGHMIEEIKLRLKGGVYFDTRDD